MDRRDFLRNIALSLSAAEALAATAGAAPTGSPVLPRDIGDAAGASRFVGIQMGPHTMLDEGIDPCLNLIQETAGINAVLA